MAKRSKKPDPIEVENRMTDEIAHALYHVLIPVEQQCVQIQAENAAIVEKVARRTWRAFVLLSRLRDEPRSKS